MVVIKNRLYKCQGLTGGGVYYALKLLRQGLSHFTVARSAQSLFGIHVRSQIPHVSHEKIPIYQTIEATSHQSLQTQDFTLGGPMYCSSLREDMETLSSPWSVLGFNACVHLKGFPPLASFVLWILPHVLHMKDRDKCSLEGDHQSPRGSWTSVLDHLGVWWTTSSLLWWD